MADLAEIYMHHDDSQERLRVVKQISTFIGNILCLCLEDKSLTKLENELLLHNSIFNVQCVLYFVNNCHFNFVLVYSLVMSSLQDELFKQLLEIGAVQEIDQGD